MNLQQRSFNVPAEIARLSPQRVAWLILNCARGTSTVSSCAFREQEDDQAALGHCTTDSEGNCKVGMC
jgi:hypothetical protein